MSTIKTGFISEIEVATAMVKVYSSLGGEVSDCYKIFSELDGRQDVISWTGIIAAYAEQDPEEAILFWAVSSRVFGARSSYVLHCLKSLCWSCN